jgi:hypothetical protein
MLTGCGDPAPSQPEKVELGILRVGRKCELHGVRYALDARFDVTGPEVLELDTNPTNDEQGRELLVGNYAITIRPGFSLWRDVAVARIQVSAELASHPERHFEITAGTSTLVAYEFVVDGETVAFDSD